jgi:hypothetical protein
MLIVEVLKTPLSVWNRLLILMVMYVHMTYLHMARVDLGMLLWVILWRRDHDKPL